MTQPKLNSYFGFKEIITNMAENRLEAVGSIEDALALTSNDLSASTSLTHNVPLRNTVQKNVGELQDTLNGLSAAQLRRKRIKRRKINENKEMAALPISNSNEFDERQHAMTISSSQATNIVSPIGSNTNNRWFRGGLHENNENDDDVNLSMITAPSMSSNLKSVISNDNERSDAVDCLRKKVIKRLIDVTSPTSESKQNMLKNWHRIKMILES